MMLNEFDDEQTIEEEEELGQDDAQDEIRLWLIPSSSNLKMSGGGQINDNFEHNLE